MRWSQPWARSSGRAAARKHGIVEGAERYFLSLFDRSRGGFRFSDGTPPTLMATAYCVLGLEFCERLQSLSEGQKLAIVSFLNSGCSEKGTFQDPLWTEEHILGDRHDAGYFVEETTAFCQQALDALLAPPPPAREWPKEWIGGDGIHEHFEGLPWDDPWRDSNRVMFTLAQLCHDAERHRRPELLHCVDSALDWLDEHQSPETGLWRGPRPASLVEAMAATFHFTFFYCYRGRELRYPNRIIDSCLSLQRPHGLFSGSDIGHTCLDYDALDLLAKASLITEHRAGDVAAAMSRAEEALIALHDPATGGFVHCRERVVERPVPLLPRLPLGYRLARVLPERRVPHRAPFHTGSSLLRADGDRSNALSTWFRLLALELAANGRRSGPEALAVRFRRLPFLGYHDVLAVRKRSPAVPRPPTSAARRSVSTPASVSERGPTISVLVPARNEARLLPEALTALRRQTYPHWEAVVVNDGSVDDTGSIAEQWSRAEPRIRALHLDGRGLGAARNAALRDSGGELVHCLDADDSIDPAFYATVVARVRRRDGSTRVGRCAVSRVGLVWEEGSEIACINPAPSPEEFGLAELARRNIRQPVCHVFERRILETTGCFDESLAHCQDWDLWLRFARVGVDFVPADEAQAWYTLRSTSLSSNYVGYLRDGSSVMRRALRPDDRCHAVKRPPLTDPSPVEEGIARFWEQNLMRAVNRHDVAAVRQIFEWGRGNLAEGFWSAPDRYGVRPEFDWAYDAPAPGLRTLETLFDRGRLFLFAMLRYWPEMDTRTADAAARSLLWRMVALADGREPADRDAMEGRRVTIAALARHLGWLDWRFMVLAALLSAPWWLRPALLRRAARVYPAAHLPLGSSVHS